MNGKTVLAAFLGAVVHFLLGWLIYGMLLMDFMAANTVEYEGLMVQGAEAMPGYVLSSLVFGIMITYFLVKTKAKNATSALISSGILVFLFGVGLDFMLYFSMNLFSLAGLVVDVIAFTVMGSLVGLVSGYVLSSGSEPVTAGAKVA